MADNENVTKRSETRKLELEKKKKQSNMIIMVAVIVIAGVLGALYLAGGDDDPEAPPTTADGDYTETQSTLVVDSSDIGTDATYYTYDNGEKTVRFFIVEGSDGEIHVAADACDVCYHEKKGYAQAGTVMECINCGLTFPINNIGSDNTAGGCWPSYIEWNEDGNDIVIEKTALAAKNYMF